MLSCSPGESAISCAGLFGYTCGDKWAWVAVFGESATYSAILGEEMKLAEGWMLQAVELGEYWCVRIIEECMFPGEPWAGRATIGECMFPGEP